MTPQLTPDSLTNIFTAREALFDAKHESAFRLCNGFTEGCPSLAIDIYGTTAVIHDYAPTTEQGHALVALAKETILAQLPWVRCLLLKTRQGLTDDQKRGTIIHGTKPDSWIREEGVRYAIDLTMNRDASLYLDTRNLRHWLQSNLAGKTVLNTFAYTGSLGVAAMAGGASRVLQLDLNKQFLNLAKTSYTLNGFKINRSDFFAADFWPSISRLKRAGTTFDAVILDPPFFATTQRGVVNLEDNSATLINKVRPLINDGGYLITINNALYLSGQAFADTLHSLCADGYLSIETLIPVPDDFVGYPNTRRGTPITDAAPFNHSTKIAILRVRRKKSPDQGASPESFPLVTLPDK